MKLEKKKLIIILSAAAAAVALILFGVLGYWLPYHEARNSMGSDRSMVLQSQEDGGLLVSWAEGTNADRYLVEVLREVPGAQEDTEPEVLYSAFVREGTQHMLEEISGEEELTIRVTSAMGYFFPFMKEERIRMGQSPVEIRGTFRMPAAGDFTWTADPDADEVTVRFDLAENSTGRLYYVEDDGSRTFLEALTTGETTLYFGEGKPFQVPSFDQAHSFALDVYTEYEGYTHYGTVTGEFTLVREDLLGTTLLMDCADEGDNAFTLTWNETKGDHYEVQRYDASSDEWISVHQVDRDGERVYNTGHLERYSHIRFRVVAIGGQTLPGSEFAATPAETEVTTGASLIFSTVWPVQDLEIYSDANKTGVLGTASKGKAFCILAEENGLFYIRFADGYGYIDSNYCMINLPEFIGDICLYDITNSYDSLYMVHEFEIPTVTGEVTVGYEKVKTGDNEYLVPLLYPTALKLEQAAFAAMDEGYKLKIYDSFRPQQATKALYDTAAALLPEPLPEKTYDGRLMEEFLGIEVTEPAEPAPPETETPGDGTAEEQEDPRMTYEELMTDFGRRRLNSFLAKGGSRHNLGVALDLTIADLRSGEDREMQSSMHDLSWYSELTHNNANANTLAKIMKGAGFAGLSSEWWHFQDDEAKEELEPALLWGGVTPECWMADDKGWRYRRSNGRFYKDCTQTIDGQEYTFDADGYVVEDLPEETETQE